MSNDKPDWIAKWGRSPRQDRRVVVNGKFVEQAEVVIPTPPQEETDTRERLRERITNDPDLNIEAGSQKQVQEVPETNDRGTSASQDVSLNGSDQLRGAKNSDDQPGVAGTGRGEETAVLPVSDSPIQSTEELNTTSDTGALGTFAASAPLTYKDPETEVSSD
jgi:hypothetical protein